jgi:uncharacterized membrane protein
MVMSEWILIGMWGSLLLGLTGLVFPLVWRVFGRRLADGGFGVSATAGIVLSGWLTFMMASLRLVGFGWTSAAISLGLVGLGSGLVVRRNRRELAQFIRLKRLLLFIELGLMVVSVVGWSLVRGFQPDIQGLEKFMDMGFVNAILRSKWTPPTDMWLSGYTINYYYFGHFLTAFLTLISGIDSAYTYNLMLATVFGLAMTGSFGFVYNYLAIRNTRKTQKAGESESRKFRKSDFSCIISALLVAMLLNFGGNLHTVWHFLSRQEKPYWYPDATRFIEYTIHEFPMYSHVVADLHGHLIDLPIVLTFLTILIVYVNSKFEYRNSKQIQNLKFKNSKPFGKLENLDLDIVSDFGFRISDLKIPVILGFLLGIMSMTNTWDVPIYGLVFAVVAAVIIYKTNREWRNRIFNLLATGGVAAIVMILISLPFHLNFQNIAQGIKWVETRSPWWQLGVLWGGFGTIGAVAVWYYSHKRWHPIGCHLFRVLPLAMVGVSALLVVIPEFIYVRDIYIKEYHRANTMFKLTYQAFVMLSLVFGLTLGDLLGERKKEEGRRKKAIALTVLLLVFAAHMMYPFLAISSYYNGLKKFQGLYGLQWLARQYPDDYRVINWMKNNIPWQLQNPPVILEAVGESYTDHARVSAFTGLPTVLGWRVHEWLWRGSFDIPGRRTEEVRAMYERPTSPEAETAFKNYQVKYILVGNLERADYKLNETEIRKLGKIIFSSGSSYLVEL